MDSFGLFICVLGIVAGCTAFRHFAGAETPQGGGDLNVLAQSEGETQQVSPQVKKSLPRGAGAWLTAGVDFPVKSSAEKARSGIDSVLDRAAEYGAAVVFLDAIRSGEAVQAGSLDTLRYAIGSASAKASAGSMRSGRRCDPDRQGWNHTGSRGFIRAVPELSGGGSAAVRLEGAFV